MTHLLRYLFLIPTALLAAAALPVAELRLPDPLTTAGGDKVNSAEMWRQTQRPEILELFRTHVYGRMPVGRPARLKFDVRETVRGVMVGAANNEQARELDIKLDFLPEGSYEAAIVQDGEHGHYQTNRETLRTENRRVTASETIHVTIAPGGGACVILAPTKKNPETGGAQEPPQQQHYTPAADLRGQWEFVPDPKLPNVLILGDSISIAYTLDVRKNLRGKANVFRPMQPDKKPQNCGDTPRGLAMLDEWLGDTRWDLIHFNWGLWDLCYRHPQSKEQGGRDKVRGKLTTTPENYERNLEKLAARLKTTGAKLIWANITVVPEGEAGRFVGDDIKYNAIAARVMERHHIPVNELHRTSKSFPPELFSGPGDVHFTAEGSAKLARQVAECISNALAACNQPIRRSP